MSNVIDFQSRRVARETGYPCQCRPGRKCYPHQLVDLGERVAEIKANAESFQFCDWSTFERLTNDVLDVIQGITDECMSSAREGLE